MTLTTPPNATRSGSPPLALWAIAKQALLQRGRVAGWLATALPMLSFVTVSGLASMRPALIMSGLTAAGVFAWQLHQRRGMRQAVVGLCLVGVFATVAGTTGEARGFFLLPTLLPFAVILVCLASIVSRRPLTGVLLNRVIGGPADWFARRRLRRTYASTTLACVGVNAINGALQAVFYAKGDSAVLAALHIVTGPIFAVIVAVTLVLARRASADQRLESSAPPCGE